MAPIPLADLFCLRYALLDQSILPNKRLVMALLGDNYLFDISQARQSYLTNVNIFGAYFIKYLARKKIMTKISKDPSKKHLIQKFNNTFRYFDDILALNNDDFSIYTKGIYSSELPLNKANIKYVHGYFRDFDIYLTGSVIAKCMMHERTFRSLL